MNMYREDNQEKALKEKSRKAISLAMESRWEEAAAVNREILDMNPQDLEACNRLGKALLELGDTDGARHAFGRALEISPTNAIAKKNLERLATMPSAPKPASLGAPRLAPKLFISDSGKSAQVTLFAPAPEHERPFVSPGAPVKIEERNGGLAVCTTNGEYLGMVPPKMGRRLLCMIQGGNRYDGVVFSATADAIKVVLRETYQHPSQRSKISFPTSEPSPQPEAANVIPDDIDDDVDMDAPEPLDLSWVDDDVEPVDEDLDEEMAPAAVAGALDDEPLFSDDGEDD